MSVKLLAGSVPGAEPIAWPHRRIHPSASPTPPQFADAEWRDAAPMPGEEHPPAGELSQLLVRQQRRIHELEREMDNRAREERQKGFAAGEAAGGQQLEPVIERMARAVEDLITLRRRVRAEAEEDSVRLVIAVAGKVLHREITVDSESLLGLVKAALQRIDAREVHRLRVHPADAPGIERHLQGGGLTPRFELTADPSLERGSAIFETSRGNLDASVGTQLQEIERGFIDLVRRNHSAI